MNVPGKLLAENERYIVYVRPALAGHAAKSAKAAGKKADKTLADKAEAGKTDGSKAKLSKSAQAKASKLKAAASQAVTELSAQLNAAVAPDTAPVKK
jgi:hypothetical protein